MTFFSRSQTAYRSPSYFGSGSTEVAPPARAGEGGVRRLATHSDALVTEPAQGVRTIPDLIEYAARMHGGKEALGWREVLGVHEEVKKGKEGKEKRWKYWDLGEYQWVSYTEFKERLEDVAKGLVELGIGKDDVVGIFAETSPNWQLLSCACALISTPIATAYDTLGSAGLAHALNEPSCAAVFANPSLLSTVLKVLPDTPSIRFVFYDGEPSHAEEEVLAKIRKVRAGDEGSGIKTMHISALRALGASHASSLPLARQPASTDTACIMYTSGSTGAPKGVVLTHANLLASVGAIRAVFGPHLETEGAKYAAYLPLAHVLEYVVELCALFCGVGMGYARARTLTAQSVWKGSRAPQSDSEDNGPDVKQEPMLGTGRGDLEELQPDIMLGVPAVWEAVRKAAEARLAKAPLLARTAFAGAMLTKQAAGAVVAYSSGLYVLGRVTHAVQQGVDAVLDATLLRPVQAALGGRVRLAMNGGAAVSGETQAWFGRVGVPLVQGYGLTETCGMCAFMPPELLSIGPVGLPAPSVEIKLVDCPESKEMGYDACPAPDAQDADGKPVLPQGEIWIRGPSVTKGYFKRPDLNVVANEDGSLPDDNDDGRNKDDAKDKPDPVFTRDGWFRTGDVGRWNADGTLSIVDRLKNLVKLQGGEYIALERLESVYKSCSLVGNMCLYANGDMTQPIAIVVPPKPKSGANKDDILNELVSLAKKNGLSRMETPSDVIVGQEEWTPENGYVTAAQKVQRAKVAEGFKEEIEGCKKAQKGK